MDRSRSLVLSVLAGIVLCIAAVVIIDRLQHASGTAITASPAAAVPLTATGPAAAVQPLVGWALVVTIGVVATGLTHQLLRRPQAARAPVHGEDHPIVAVDHGRDEAAQRRAADTVTRGLAEMASQLAPSLDVERATDQVVSAAVRLFRVRRALLYAVDEPGGTLVGIAAAGEGDPARWLGRPLPLAGTLAGRAVADRRPAASADVVSEIGPSLPVWARDLLQHEGNAAAIAVPVLTGARVSGVLVLVAPAGRIFGDDESRLLVAFADHATLALQTASVLAASESRRRVAQTLLDAARTFGSALPLQNALDLAAERTALAVGADRCTIHVRRGDRLVVATTRRAGQDAAPRGDERWALDHAPALDEALRSRDAVVIDDATRSSLVTDAWRTAGVTAAIVAPLLYRETAIGTLTLERRRRPGPWESEHLDLARAIAYQAASAIETSGPAAASGDRRTVPPSSSAPAAPPR